MITIGQGINIGNGITLGGSGSIPISNKGSILFNGTSQYLSVPAGTQWQLGTGDYTIEWWQYMTSQPNNPRVFSVGNYPSAAIAVSIESVSGIFYLWEASGFRFNYTLSTGGYLNQWIHFAISRVSNTTRVFKNGTQIGSSFSDSYNINNTTSVLSIGQESTATANSYFPGYITNFRLVKGTGVYTSNFTPPSTELTAISGTQLLLNTLTGAGFLQDSSPNNFTVTNNNGATSSTLSPI